METSIEDDKQEKPPEEEIPEIKVEPAEGEEEMAPKKKRTSFAVSPSRSRTKAKPLNEIPDQGIQMKGYVHRKKGTFGGWERTYCVVTFTAMYFTTGEDVREYHHMCMFDGVGSVKREKKGHDKQSESLFVKSGKNKETLSLAAGELQTWFSSLEEVLGVSQVNLELGSEDEDDGTPAPPPAPAAAAVPIIEDGERGSCVVQLCFFGTHWLLWMCAFSLLSMYILYTTPRCAARTDSVEKPRKPLHCNSADHCGVWAGAWLMYRGVFVLLCPTSHITARNGLPSILIHVYWPLCTHGVCFWCEIETSCQ